LISGDGRAISDHAEKTTLLWNEYRNRLGQTTNTTMHFELEGLVQQHDVHQIEVPFTKEDIDKVVMRMPSDKAPSPDGFNGLFIKCRHIIKLDIYQLCFDFFSEEINLQAINNSFTTLIPKVNTPSIVNGFSPISLINSIFKIITKLLGYRLQSIIIPLVHKN
jgi:hypothetical protein